MVYSNLLSIVQAWVAQGRVQFDFGWWVLHAAMLGLIAFLFLPAQYPRVQALAAAMKTVTALPRARDLQGDGVRLRSAFLALFVFFDLINELDDLGKGHYRLGHVFLFVLLSMPGARLRAVPDRGADRHAVRAAHLAANSEYTVMRVSGFSPLQAAGTLARGRRCVRRCSPPLFGELVGPQAEQIGAAAAARPPRRRGRLGAAHRGCG